jgi:putative membrane protein insertion efficiency factor
MSDKADLSLPQKAALGLIKWYQRYWSPDHSHRKSQFPYGYCRFTPTCSQYGYDTIVKYGVIKGSILAFWRILRCNPWSKGGHDPVK